MLTRNPGEVVEKLEEELHQLLRHRIQNLHVEWRGGSLFLQGRARSYYHKQIAQEHVLSRCQYPVNAKGITV